MITLKDNYKTEKKKIGFFGKHFPTVTFYIGLLRVVFSSSSIAKKGGYNDDEWVKSSYDTLRFLESVGCEIEVTGVENFANEPEPVVFIGNHMSTLETFILPCLIQPKKPVTFVVKKSLVEYPVFRHIMVARDPIVVSRDNPREDLKTVLNDGTEKLSKGVSVIVFPQTTRTPVFDSKQFNTIGIKLAKKAGVKVVPVALKTDAWTNGKLIKDFGKIYPERKVMFAFGKPMEITGRGDEEHEAIISFIKEHLKKWGHKEIIS
ncbi:1-acyl-sn-glycerol-3-phosphate acyltransferase [Deferribacteraceae bacterium V6Fe1]|nr:1-acyl-sn-glycerol-3-phosphate acyltransferase [Deferribacteraceae bacterium V6Fe1]